MPLLDHFHPPLSTERHQEAFHASWADEIMATLNQGGLPPGYFAETQVHFGGRVEVDVAALERSSGSAPSPTNNGEVAVEIAQETDVLLMPAVFPDEVEIRIIQRSGGPTLVGAIELISPGNKDRPESRRAFAEKCAAYLHAGVGLLVVDIVTERNANLHDELIVQMNREPVYRFPTMTPLYCVAYRPLRTEQHGDQIEIRRATLAVGKALPRMPLALRGGPSVPLDLENSYARTRQKTML